MGPRGRFYSYMYHVIDVGTGVVLRLELPIQRRLCPIFVRNVGSPDIHEYFRGLTGSQRTPRFWGVTDMVTLGSIEIVYFSDVLTCRNNYVLQHIVERI